MGTYVVAYDLLPKLLKGVDAHAANKYKIY